MGEIVPLAFAVVVPSSMVELHEPNASFHKPPGQQAVVPETPLTGLSAVEQMCLRRFFVDSSQFWNARLHSKGQFILRDSGLDLGIKGCSMMDLVQVAQRIQAVSPNFARHSVWVVNEKNGLTI